MRIKKRPSELEGRFFYLEEYYLRPKPTGLPTRVIAQRNPSQAED